MIITAGYMAFAAYAREYRRKVRTLYGLIAAIEKIRQEVYTRQTPFPEIFDQLAGEQTDVERFFAALVTDDETKLQNRWEQGVMKWIDPMGIECGDILRGVGAGIGTSMAEEQLRIFDEALIQLRRIYREVSEQTESRIRLWRRLCPGIAAAAALMLW